MATKFANFDLATGSNDGSDWDNAWKTMQDAHDGASAGDDILCKGTDTLSSTVTLTTAGTYNGGYIKFVGVASTYTGTDPVTGNTGGSDRAVIDGNSGAFSGLTFNGASYVWLENFEVKDCGTTTGHHGITAITAYSDRCATINVYSHGNAGRGFDPNAGYLRYGVFLRCRASQNGSDGFYNPKFCTLYFCRADNNSGYGIKGYDTQAIGCIAHDNANGFYLYDAACCYGNTAEGNTGKGIDLLYATAINAVVGCRSANNGTGFAFDTTTSQRSLMFFCYGDNTTETSGYYDEVLNDGSSTVTLNGTDTDEGFNDSSTNDYNLTSSATYRREEVVIP